MAIDNGVFRLHYKVIVFKFFTLNVLSRLHKVTVLLFILFSAMLTAKQYFGDPIDCMVSGVPSELLTSITNL